MLEKIDKRNFKKVWIWYAVAAVIAAVAAAAVLYTVIGTGTAVTHHHEYIIVTIYSPDVRRGGSVSDISEKDAVDGSYGC